MASEHFSWDQRNTERLIEQWSSKPCLYDPSCVDYRDKTKRENAMAELAAALGTIDGDIRDKMKTLRSQYSRERTHEDRSQSEASRAPGRAPYKSKWMFFSRLSFLDEHKRRPRRRPDDAACDDELNEPANQRLAGATEYPAVHERLAFASSSTPPPSLGGGERVNGLAAAEPLEEPELTIDADAPTSGALPRVAKLRGFTRAQHLRGDDDEDELQQWAAPSGSWRRAAAAATGPRHQRASALLHAAEVRRRYGDARSLASSSRDAATRRRESSAAWRAATAASADASAAERSPRPAPPLPPTMSRRLQQQTDASATMSDSAPYANGGLDVDLLLRLAEAAAMRAIAGGCAARPPAAAAPPEAEDAESAFGHFIARQLRLLTSGQERQLARLRIHRAMVDALAADNADESTPTLANSSSSGGGGRS